MTTSLGSMSSSCLQQRESYHHHPYMFHDPLSLSAQYAAHPSRHHTPCNPAAAHQQSHAQHGNYATPGSANTNSSSSGTGMCALSAFTWLRCTKLFNLFSGVITAGVSVPVQISTQTADLSGAYWSRLQWSKIIFIFANINFTFTTIPLRLKGEHTRQLTSEKFSAICQRGVSMPLAFFYSVHRFCCLINMCWDTST